jgi:HPt (histidine-containing phosphotransfer) domain-containing protein
MGDAAQATIAAAMNRLWRQYLPQIQERAATLEAAAAALGKCNLSPVLREEANSAAHKLAGVLGTFGLDQGTVLAREAEEFYSGRQPSIEGGQSRLAEIAREIAEMVASRE